MHRVSRYMEAQCVQCVSSLQSLLLRRSTAELSHEGGSRQRSRTDDTPHISGSSETQIYGINSVEEPLVLSLFRSESEHKEACAIVVFRARRAVWGSSGIFHQWVFVGRGRSPGEASHSQSLHLSSHPLLPAPICCKQILKFNCSA